MHLKRVLGDLLTRELPSLSLALHGTCLHCYVTLSYNVAYTTYVLFTDGSYCGRQLASFKPLNRGVNSSNDYDYTLDNDTNDARQLDKILGGTYVTYGEIPGKWQYCLNTSTCARGQS